jgi:hypothetical protein
MSDQWAVYALRFRKSQKILAIAKKMFFWGDVFALALQSEEECKYFGNFIPQIEIIILNV